jgi:DNA-binding transcriptional ArsR family regulator
LVKHSDRALDRTFAALADPARRPLLARLGMSEVLSVSELAQPFAISLTAIMKHLEVLSDPRLIVRAKTGHIVACRLTADPMEQAMEWLARYEHLVRKPRPTCGFCGARRMAVKSSSAGKAGPII